MAAAATTSRRAWLVALLLVALFSLSVARREGEGEEEARRRRQARTLLKRLNKPPLATFQSPDGDIIDCVHISRQPAFDHPLLKNHKIQMWPSTQPSGMYDEAARPFTQIWNQNGEECPDNTVPIRRTKEKDVMRATSVTTFGKKTHESPHPDHLGGVTDEHHYGIARVTGDAYYGTKVSINLWQPTIATSRDFSLAQLWIAAGSYDNNGLNTIEAGWQVYPFLYGDNNTRFFIYWTRDAYNSTGCYNLACSGFIQTNRQFALGGSISPVSTYGGEQYEYEYFVWKDPDEGNWWLKVRGNNLGYWPSSIFTLLQAGAAERVSWGGEVYSPRMTTPMGSGHFPEEGYGKATYSRAIQVVDSSNNLKKPNGVFLINALPNCYNVTMHSSNNTSWGTHIFYGGPGCPQNSQIEVM